MIATGFTPPFSPRGHANVAPIPPWHYVADFITIAFETDAKAVQSLLPPNLIVDEENGAAQCTVSFAAWQASTDEGKEFLDPKRSQYNECLIFVHARYGDEMVAYCPYIYVDSDLSMVRGWLLGYPKKIGSVSTTRAFQLGSPASPSLGHGGEFGGVLGLHDRRLAEGGVSLKSMASEDAPIFGSRPIVTRRHFASLYEGEENLPAVDELARLKSENFQLSSVWEGDANLKFYESPTEDLDALSPTRVHRGYRYTVAMTNRNNIKLKDLRA